MKIYYQNNGCYGSIVVVADNEKDARSYMEEELNYSPDKEVVAYDIVVGLTLSNLGDM